jgi:hypothetical protein
MTSPRSQYLVHILEKIGTPLLSSIHMVEDGADAHGTQAAKTMASLLAKTVELSIALGNTADVFDGTDDDALRVALAALAGPIIAARYRFDKKMPDDDVLKKIVAGMESALTFSDNFTPSKKTNDTVAALQDGASTPDETGPPIHTLHFLQALLPVVNAVTHFAFGQNEQKLIADIGVRLSKTAETLRGTLFPVTLSDDEKKASDLVTLRTAADIYAACHMAETQTVAGSSDEQNTAAALQNVWTAFDQHIALLETLTRAILDPTSVPVEVVPTPSPTPVTAPPKPQAQQQTPPPTDSLPATQQKPAIFGGGGQTEEQSEVPAPTEESAAKPQTPPPPSTPPETSGNPMGFFGKKDNDETSEAASPPPEQQTAPPTPEQQDTPSTPPPQEQKTDDGNGNPMSFFTPKPDDGDDDDE